MVLVVRLCSHLNSLVLEIKGVYAQFLVQYQSIDDPKDNGGFMSVIMVIMSSVTARVIVVIILWS